MLTLFTWLGFALLAWAVFSFGKYLFALWRSERTGAMTRQSALGDLTTALIGMGIAMVGSFGAVRILTGHAPDLIASYPAAFQFVAFLLGFAVSLLVSSLYLRYMRPHIRHYFAPEVELKEDITW